MLTYSLCKNEKGENYYEINRQKNEINVPLHGAGCGYGIYCSRMRQQDREYSESTEAQKIVLGDGSVKITVIVVDADGNETDFVVNTDKETVGDALLEQNLIEGEEGDYGLYVKTVNGITADYDTDQTYWAFYVNGEYASTGVDSIPVNEGDTYEFKVEK